jgi:predicted nuclease with TOPRIM domain
MLENVNNELKKLEQEAARIEKQRVSLLKKQQEAERQMKKLDKLVKDSNYKTAKQLVEALVSHYKISPSQISAGRSRRKYTRVNAALRDNIRADLKAGLKKSDIGRKYGVTYPVVAGVEKGKYNKI